MNAACHACFSYPSLKLQCCWPENIFPLLNFQSGHKSFLRCWMPHNAFSLCRNSSAVPRGGVILTLWDRDSLWHWLIHCMFALIFTSSSWSCFRLRFHYSSTLGEESSANTALTRKPQRMKRPFIAVMMPRSSPLQLHFENKRPGGKVTTHKQNLQLCSHRGLVQMGLMQMPENILPIDTREQQEPKL